MQAVAAHWGGRRDASVGAAGVRSETVGRRSLQVSPEAPLNCSNVYGKSSGRTPALVDLQAGLAQPVGLVRQRLILSREFFGLLHLPTPRALLTQGSPSFMRPRNGIRPRKTISLYQLDRWKSPQPDIEEHAARHDHRPELHDNEPLSLKLLSI